MDRKKYFDFLLEKHRKIMQDVDKETPTLTLRSTLVHQEFSSFGHKYTFKIIDTSSKVALKTLLEQKIFIDGQEQIKGNVIDYYEDTLVIIMKKILEKGAYVLKRYANYNNEVLLKTAINFSNSEKYVHPTLYQNNRLFNTNRIEEINTSMDIDKPKVLDADKKSFFFSKALNISQKMAVLHAMNNIPFKIMGPPGTGKTETIVEIISQYIGNKKSVLVCGPSNVSIDNIILRFQASEYNMKNTTSFYRLGSCTKGLTHVNLESLANEAVGFMDEEEEEMKKKGNSAKKELYKRHKPKDSFVSDGLRLIIKDKFERKKEFIKDLKTKTSLVFATLFSSLKENFYFDLCIVDEACQAQLLECVMGILKARNYILVGDPKQLCPPHSSLYETVVLPTIMLNEQYRMHADLMSFSNSYFYNSMVCSYKNDNFSFFDEKKIIFIDTSFFSFEESSAGLSKINTGEAMLVGDVVRWIESHMNTYEKEDACFTKNCNKKYEIGVIAPYSAQVSLIRETIGSSTNCSVDTVDGFQGQERDFIILSLVRSNEELEYGFLTDQKRMNVALTRCKKGLVIIGDSVNFRKNSFFKEFFKFLEKNAYIVDPETFKVLSKGRND